MSYQWETITHGSDSYYYDVIIITERGGGNAQKHHRCDRAERNSNVFSVPGSGAELREGNRYGERAHNRKVVRSNKTKEGRNSVSAQLLLNELKLVS